MMAECIVCKERGKGFDLCVRCEHEFCDGCRAVVLDSIGTPRLCENCHSVMGAAIVRRFISCLEYVSDERIYKFFRPDECVHKAHPSHHVKFVCLFCNKSVTDYPNIFVGVPVNFTTFDGMKWLLKEILRMDSDHHFELQGHPDFNHARILKTTAEGTDIVAQSIYTKVYDTLPIAVAEAVREMIRRIDNG